MLKRKTKGKNVALTVAGADCSGGAGIQADLRVFAAMGICGASAITAVVAENTHRVKRIDPLPAASVAAQIEMIFEEFTVAAIKTGMLFSAEIIQALVSTLRKGKKIPPLVIDPVMISSSGKNLLQRAAIITLTKKLFPLATLVTPNLNETAVLLGCKSNDLQKAHALREAGAALSKQHGVAFLIKGGHLPGKESIDFLCEGKKVRAYSALRIKNGEKVRGTGCMFSAAITAGLAKDLSLEEAVKLGKKWIIKQLETQHN